MLVVAAVLRRDDRVLVCQRPKRKHHGGFWEFPGGKIEPGEGPQAALQRELEEELGLRSVRVLRELFVHESAALTLRFFEIATDEEPRCLEHEALAWIDPLAASPVPLAPSDQVFFSQHAPIERELRVLDALVVEALDGGASPHAPWRAFPQMPRYSAGWYIGGGGESLLMAWGRWAEGRTHQEILGALRAQAPLPVDWQDWAAALLFPEDEDPDAGLALLAGCGLIDSRG